MVCTYSYTLWYAYSVGEVAYSQCMELIQLCRDVMRFSPCLLIFCALYPSVLLLTCPPSSAFNSFLPPLGGDIRVNSRSRPEYLAVTLRHSKTDIFGCEYFVTGVVLYIFLRTRGNSDLWCDGMGVYSVARYWKGVGATHTLPWYFGWVASGCQGGHRRSPGGGWGPGPWGMAAAECAQ